MGTKSKKSKITGRKLGAIISDSVGDHGNHPFFVKKAEEAKEFLKKYPLPENLGNKSTTK